jgi:hypothetical protein
MLYDKGWRNHEVLFEGLPGWLEKGYPAEGTDLKSPPAH